MTEHILVVEDEEDIQQLVSYNLVRAGFRVTCADSGEEALEKLRGGAPDLVLLDLMLPGASGFEVCRRLKESPGTAGVPVVMVTAKGEEEDIVAGLELGADDYITKPFSPRVLLARVRAVLRRTAKTPPASDETGETVLAFPDLEIRPDRHEALAQGSPVHLTVTEYAILHLLARRRGWVFTRQQIIDAVRGVDYTITTRAVDVQVFGLRRKLGKAGRYIETVRGIGYRFKE